MEEEIFNKGAKSNSYEYVGFWKRVKISIVDIICIFPIIFLYQYAINQSIESLNVLFISLYYILLYGYFAFMVVKFGGTPGRLLLKTRIIDKDGNKLSVVKAVMRLSTYILNSIFFIIVIQQTINIIIIEGLHNKEAIDFYKGYRDNSAP